MPTLGTLIWVPIAIIIVIVGLWLAVKAALIWRGTRDDDYYSSSDADDAWMFIGLFSGILALIVLGGTLYGMWPYSWDYHHWSTVNGQVERVSSRLLPNGDAVEQKFVVILRDHGEPYGIQDTRASLLKPGDEVSLKCKKAYVFQSQSGWDCNWNGGAPTGGEN